MRHPINAFRIMMTMAIAPIAVALAGQANGDRVALWRLAGEGRGVPAIHGDTIYALSKRHEVLALNAETGEPRWRRATGEPGDDTQGTAVVVAGGTVVAGDYNLHGLRASTGEAIWKFEPRHGYGPGLYLGDTNGTLVVAGSPSGRLYAVDAASGHERWSTLVDEAPRTTAFAPVIAGDLAIATYTIFRAPNDGGVVALDLATGRRVWRTVFGTGQPPQAMGAAGGPVAAGDVVIAASGEGMIRAFDRRTGAARWQLPGVGALGESYAQWDARDYRAMSHGGGRLYVASLSGVVLAYDLATRREVWRHVPAARLSAGFAIASDDKRVYVPYANGRLVVLDAATGEEQWRTGDWKSGFYWSPALRGDRLFVAGAGAGFAVFAR